MRAPFEFGKFIRVFSIALILLLITLTLTNPSEVRYLDRISDDYGQMHGGLEFSPDDLLKMGDGKRTTYGLFSHYEYSFGKIKVEYIGVAGSVYYLGSDTSENNQKTNDPDILI
jgi:hypothetical protein